MVMGLRSFVSIKVTMDLLTHSERSDHNATTMSLRCNLKDAASLHLVNPIGVYFALIGKSLN